MSENNKTHKILQFASDPFQISDNIIASTKPVIRSMESLCVSKVFAIRRSDETVGTANDSSVLIQEVQQFICPSQCSDQGVCENGTCSCNPGKISVLL